MVKDYPYNGRNVRSYFASGNGDQIAKAIPELSLVLAFDAGNYHNTGGATVRNINVPKYILHPLMSNP